MAQHTLAAAGRIAGIGLHSGEPVAVTLRPARPGTGLSVVRDDLLGAAPVPVRVDRVVDSRLATVLGGSGWRVGTVEHLLAALLAEGLDNAEIGVEGPEVPVLDGSAAPWVALVRSVGLRRQDAPRRQIRVLEVVEVSEGSRRARLLPAEGLELSAAIHFDHPAIGAQRCAVRVDADAFSSGLAWARTFGFLHEVETMRAAGLARGGSLNNALVYGPEGVINPEGARSPDEPVRHKLVDMLGDLALLGMPVLGRFEAELPGHALSAQLMRALLARTGAWCLVEG